jgi:hypothetical protein
MNDSQGFAEDEEKKRDRRSQVRDGREEKESKGNNRAFDRGQPPAAVLCRVQKQHTGPHKLATRTRGSRGVNTKLRQHLTMPGLMRWIIDGLGADADGRHASNQPWSMPPFAWHHGQHGCQGGLPGAILTQ